MTTTTPENGIRLLLYPANGVCQGSLYKWKNGGKGEGQVDFISGVVKILQAAKAMEQDGSWSMGSLRQGNAHNLARAGFPDSIRTAIIGHSWSGNGSC